jgi:hypothetical protein
MPVATSRRFDADRATTAALSSGTATDLVRLQVEGVNIDLPSLYYGGTWTLSSAGGTVIVEVFRDSDGTDCVGRATLDFTTYPSVPVLFWERGKCMPDGVWFRATGDGTSASKTIAHVADIEAL